MTASKTVTIIRLNDDARHESDHDTRTEVWGEGRFVKKYQYSQGIFSYGRTDDIFEAEDCTRGKDFARKLFKGIGKLETYEMTMEKKK